MDAQEQFQGFLSKYEPGVAAEAKKSLAKLRKLIANAQEIEKLAKQIRDRAKK